jgi:hypothetical protein
VKVRFLLDENLSYRLKIALLHLDPTIDILRVGDPGTPPLGTLDPEVLHYLESSQRILITDNRKSMPDHLTAHWATGGHLKGTILGASKKSYRRISTKSVSSLGNYFRLGMELSA